jgi:hypothetical protein
MADLLAVDKLLAGIVVHIASKTIPPWTADDRSKMPADLCVLLNITADVAAVLLIDRAREHGTRSYS